MNNFETSNFRRIPQILAQLCLLSLILSACGKQSDDPFRSRLAGKVQTTPHSATSCPQVTSGVYRSQSAGHEAITLSRGANNAIMMTVYLDRDQDWIQVPATGEVVCRRANNGNELCGQLSCQSGVFILSFAAETSTSEEVAGRVTLSSGGQALDVSFEANNRPRTDDRYYKSMDL